LRGKAAITNAAAQRMAYIRSQATSKNETMQAEVVVVDAPRRMSGTLKFDKLYQISSFPLNPRERVRDREPPRGKSMASDAPQNFPPHGVQTF
jgi:hypothetical protein